MKVYLSIIILGLLISALLLMLMLSAAMKQTFDMSKSSPFECGFLSLEESRVCFSIHFIMVSLVFLVFDIELVLLFPFVPATMFSSGLFKFMMFILFLILLSAGLAVEWEKSVLKWSA